MISGAARAAGLVFMGGAFGCAARITVFLGIYASFLSPGNHLGVAMAATLTVNLFGAFLLGIVAQLHQQKRLSNAIWLACGVGALGAFTTFSALTLDIFVAWQWGLRAVALSYAVISLVGSVAVLALGYWASGRLLPSTASQL